MERHVALLRPESLDRDMIDERAREPLNMADAKDIVIFLDPAEPPAVRAFVRDLKAFHGQRPFRLSATSSKPNTIRTAAVREQRGTEPATTSMIYGATINNHVHPSPMWGGAGEGLFLRALPD